MDNGFVGFCGLTKWNKCTILSNTKDSEGGAIMKNTEKRSSEGDGLLQDGVHKQNLEKLVSFAEGLDEDGTLIPTFLALLEMCFQGEKHGLKKF